MMAIFARRGIMRKLGRWRRIGADRDGATAIEYGLIIGLIALGILGSVGALGNLVNAMYDTIAGRTVEVANSTSPDNNQQQ